MRNSIFTLFIALIVTSALSTLCVREHRVPEYVPSIKRLSAPPDFFDRHEEYYNWQSENILDLVEEVIIIYPPHVSEPLTRQMAMLMLDAVFHDEEAPARPSVQAFHNSRTAHALNEMEISRVKKGAFIWKLYDMGIVIRTKSVTLGFDLVRGYSSKVEEFAITDSLMEAIIDQCDVLFITHKHRDHADEWVARKFLDQGKPVVAPPQVWEDIPLFDKITHLEREAHKIQYLPVQSGKIDLKTVIYPGHQGTSTENNVTLVITPENIIFCHTGDQSLIDDFSWIDEVGSHFRVDVLIPNCWTTDPVRTASGYNPKLIIPAHENELGHTIDHREAYALDYSRWDVPYPKIIMTWGERYHYKP